MARADADVPLFARTADAARTLEAWERHVRGERIASELVREHVRGAWQRSAGLGASPHTRVARALAPEALARLLTRERALLSAAEPYLRALVRAAAGEHHAAMLGTADGIVLRVLGDRDHVDAPGFPRAGSLLDEATSGANGIGTPLAEGAYVELVGPEHYIAGFHAYTCQGTPIRGPGGAVTGVLSMSVRRVQAAERVHEILLCAARGIEGELARRQLERDMDRLLRCDRVKAEPFERLRQDVVQVQAAARLKLEVAAIAAGRASMRDALVLARSAEELVERFRQRSSLWQLLASDAPSPPQRLDLRARLADLAELLHTEAAVRRIVLVIPPGGPVLAEADPASVSRQLFRALLRAFASSGPGQTVRVELEERGADAIVTVTRPGAAESVTLTFRRALA